MLVKLLQRDVARGRARASVYLKTSSPVTRQQHASRPECARAALNLKGSVHIYITCTLADPFSAVVDEQEAPLQGVGTLSHTSALVLTQNRQPSGACARKARCSMLSSVSKQGMRAACMCKASRWLSTDQRLTGACRILTQRSLRRLVHCRKSLLLRLAVPGIDALWRDPAPPARCDAEHAQVCVCSRRSETV